MLDFYGIVLILAIVAIVVLVWLMISSKRRLRAAYRGGRGHRNGNSSLPEEKQTGNHSDEKQSEIELEKVHEQIRGRKELARKTDISYLLWSLYRNQFRIINSRAMDNYNPGEKWYELKIEKTGSDGNLNEYKFELKGKQYRFVDDEDLRGWSDKIKHFNLRLFDETERCLIEIPMKVKIDRWGSTYTVNSHAPSAFLPGDWVSDFANATLKLQSIRNQEIRAQQHQERLLEIEDLKNRFGLSD